MKKETNTMDIVAYGLTKRELMASMALQGMLANTNYSTKGETYVKAAVELADALIKELEKEGGE